MHDIAEYIVILMLKYRLTSVGVAMAFDRGSVTLGGLQSEVAEIGTEFNFSSGI